MFWKLPTDEPNAVRSLGGVPGSIHFFDDDRVIAIVDDAGATELLRYREFEQTQLAGLGEQ